MKRMKLRDAWMVLNRTHGSILSSIRRTRRETIEQYCHMVGAPWKHRKKKGDVCIRVSIYVESGRL
jgi:hypothetical protein